MGKDEFTKLFDYMQKMHGDISNTQDDITTKMATKDDISRILNVLDQHSAILEDHDAERLSLSS